jgi:hypothetical protein
LRRLEPLSPGCPGTPGFLARVLGSVRSSLPVPLRDLVRKRVRALREQADPIPAPAATGVDGAAGADSPHPGRNPVIDSSVSTEVRSEPAGPVPDASIPPEPVSEPTRGAQERKRRKRKPLPELPVPTFVMVSPGRYVRAEDPSPSPPPPAVGEVEADEDSPPDAPGPVEETPAPLVDSIVAGDEQPIPPE